MTSPAHLVVMGVSGSGKSTIGRALAERLGYDFIEGDEFHPQANVDKMASGRPLNDDDRWPWLRTLAAATREREEAGHRTVLTCSALKRSYRDVLRQGADDMCFVHLTGDKGLMLQRMQTREHFMAPTMLESQLDTLQPLGRDERGIEVDIADSVAQVVDAIVDRLGLGDAVRDQS